MSKFKVGDRVRATRVPQNAADAEYQVQPGDVGLVVECKNSWCRGPCVRWGGEETRHDYSIMLDKLEPAADAPAVGAPVPESLAGVRVGAPSSQPWRFNNRPDSMGAGRVLICMHSDGTRNELKWEWMTNHATKEGAELAEKYRGAPVYSYAFVALCEHCRTVHVQPGYTLNNVPPAALAPDSQTTGDLRGERDKLRADVARLEAR